MRVPRWHDNRVMLHSRRRDDSTRSTNSVARLFTVQYTHYSSLITFDGDCCWLYPCLSRKSFLPCLAVSTVCHYLLYCISIVSQQQQQQQHHIPARWYLRCFHVFVWVYGVFSSGGELSRGKGREWWCACTLGEQLQHTVIVSLWSYYVFGCAMYVFGWDESNSLWWF